MRYLALVALLLVSGGPPDTPQVGDHMKVVYADDARMVAVDLEHQVHESKNVISFISLILFAQQKNGAAWIAGRMAIDCTAERMRFESEFAMSPDGKVLANVLSDAEKQWDSIPPNSVGSDVYALVCGRPLMPQVET